MTEKSDRQDGDGLREALRSVPSADRTLNDTLYALELAHSLLPNSPARDKIWLASIRLKRALSPSLTAKANYQDDIQRIQDEIHKYGIEG